MNYFLSIIKRLVFQLFLILCLYFISRICFTLLHIELFRPININSFLNCAIRGIRFDIAVFFILSAPYLLALILFSNFFNQQNRNRYLNYLFVIPNSIGLLFEISDWGYFPFNHKRSTADVLDMITRKSDFFNLLPQFLATYWYCVFAAIFSIILLYKANDFLFKKSPIQKANIISIQYFVTILIIVGVSIVGIRGGLQLIPIGIRNAVTEKGGQYTPIILNTPFSIISTYNNATLEDLHLMSMDEANELIPVVKSYESKRFKKNNVVVIILESFSKEYTCLGGGNISYTPFLDELMNKSLVCVNAYANGYRSAEGIPAILAGLPALQDEPFTTSPYGINRITSIPNQLNKKGYSSAFYHGGNYGTMSFDLFTTNAGIKRYVGREQYPNSNQYDGHWGIWDEPFLQFAAEDIDKNLKQPFCASIFTLTSHFPYKIPKQYSNTFPKGDLAIHESIGYTDFALKQFFKKIEKYDWYNNTLFIITADHCSPLGSNAYYYNGIGRFAIPIIYYCPSDSSLRGTYSGWTQQIDILPSTLHYLGLNDKFFALGNSIFDENAKSFAIQYQSGNHYWMMDSFSTQSVNKELIGFYNQVTDSLHNINLLNTNMDQAKYYKKYNDAFRQLYNYHMINNTLWIQ
jgi:phosphoglycerol transferase MdoB-like AlkP superfamily enzyme